MEKLPFQQIIANLTRSSQGSTQGPNVENKPPCIICSDYKAVTLDLPVTHEYFGVSVMCPLCCEPLLEEGRWKYSGIADDERHLTFENYKIESDAHREAYNVMIEAVQEQSMIDLVVIYGPTGTGKTHLGTAAVIEWINQKKMAKVVRCGEWLDRLKDSFKNDGDTTFVMQSMYNPHYLVIDEVKCRTTYDWDALDEVCGRRWDRHYPTILITNKDREELWEKLSRIVSRSREYPRGRLVLLDGDDYRERVNKKEVNDD